MNRIRSGVLVPVPPLNPGGLSAPSEKLLFGLPIVVLRVAWVVSAEGGGGRDAIEGSGACKDADMVEARQRKHSPVP